MMNGAAAGLIFAFLLATAYGAGFHLLVGGPVRRIPTYIIASWLGFTIGHFVGAVLGITWFKLGTVHLLTASLTAWIMLVLARWLSRPEATEGQEELTD
ncbi:MAG: hypothetical protein IPL78_25365 [Chloroflexi bacterium]|nr:hypothetical protein [Chloroflexota bacterium]